MNFLWHDYETFGTRPAWDRPVQFAALRTNDELEPIGEPIDLFARPADDTLPHPMACLVTGITPQRAERDGVPEAEFAARIHEAFSEPGTCGVGYNSLKFDDHVTRYLFYRNFFDPYEREWARGNSRWDLINLARACYALRPDGLQWPEREPGVPSFRLEDLTAANDIGHVGAHDALSDVRATVDLARRLKAAQPRLFTWSLGLRQKAAAERLLAAGEPLVHTSGRLPAARGCTTLVLPLTTVPDRPKEWIVFDLMADPEPLLTLDADAIRDRVFTASADLPEDVERIPLKTVGTNKVPMLAPEATLRGVDLERIGLDPERCRAHARQLQARLGDLRARLMEVYQPPPPLGGTDPDGLLYGGGFFSDTDRRGMTKLRATPPPELADFDWRFEDPRLPEMVFRYRARNWPDTLTAAEAERWEADRLQRLKAPREEGPLDAAGFMAELASAREARSGEPADLRLLDQVEAWGRNLLGPG